MLGMEPRPGLFQRFNDGSLHRSGVLSLLWYSKLLLSLPAAKRDLANPNVNWACGVRIARPRSIGFERDSFTAENFDESSPVSESLSSGKACNLLHWGVKFVRQMLLFPFSASFTLYSVDKSGKNGFTMENESPETKLSFSVSSVSSFALSSRHGS